MKKITLLAWFVLGILTLGNAQNIISVDNSTGANADYSELQTAISAASDGDIIYVQPSETNYGNISIDKQLTLIGYSHSSPDKKSFVGNINLLDGASNTTLNGLYANNFYTNNSTTLTGLVVENCYFEQNFYMDNPVDGAIIRGNVLYRVGRANGTASYDNFTNTLIVNNIITYQIGTKNPLTTTIKNNIFLKRTTADQVENANSSAGTLIVQNCIFLASSTSSYDINRSGVQFENCLAYNRGSGNMTALTGTNNLNNIDPLFVEDDDNAIFNAVNDDYHLQAGSPAIDAGVDGEDMGIYDGGSFIFNNYGFTNGIPSITIEAISTTVAPGENLNVIINTTNN